METIKWVLCPICGNKTRTIMQEDTELKNFPLYCPKCKQQTLVNVKHFVVSVSIDSAIPVISLGASTTALYSVMLKIVENEEGYIIWDFLKAFKRNFRQSTTVWCILLGIGVALFADYQFVQNISGVMRTIGMVLLGMIVLVYIYEVVFVFPLIARFDNTTINMLKNAVLIPISRLPYAVFVLGLSGMCV